MLPIIGMMAAWGTHVAPAPVFWSGALWPIVVGTFFSYANFVLAGYTKDISADRATGYNTLPVVFGWSKTAFASDVFAGLSVLAAGWAIAPLIASGRVFSSRGISILALAAAAAVLVLAQLELHRVRDEKSAFKPIVNVVRGFILLRLAETVSLRPGWTPAAAVFYVCFEWVLSRRPAKEQV